jgi:hypothetical protein
MFASSEMLNLTAKRIAMLANDEVGRVARTITGREAYSGEVTGAILGLMPHIVEKAILTSPLLPADVAVRLCVRFVNEFEAVVKTVSNAGGFANPIKKALFNAGFHTMFRREYNDLKPKVDKLWEEARMEHANPMEHLAYVVLAGVEAAAGYPIEDDSSIGATSTLIEHFFERVHAAIKGA